MSSGGAPDPAAFRADTHAADAAPAVFTPRSWPRVAALFDVGAELPDAQRAAWLRTLADTEPEIAPHVAMLLQAHQHSADAGFLTGGPQVSAATWQGLAAAGRATGDVIGRHRLLAWVAAGGMGQVWRAEPLQGPPGRSVALKLPLLHRSGPDGAERFQREAALLAALQHPHIARLVDAGEADDGTPWLAMEWVQGTPLLDGCRARGSTVPQRLRLFLQVLDAVAHAHSRLVIHRDLKPSNVLLTDDGDVKLLDFGIAKLLQPDGVAAASELTRRAGPVLTVAYAAPEQVRGEALTPAADVYALGVLLFELLSGERPYRLKFAGAAQLEQAVAAADVRRLAEVCPRLPRGVRIDLDAIVGKALQRVPEARYAGAREFADDLRRHLAGQPVLAQPPTAGYLLRKALQRHRTAAAALAFSALAWLVGGGVALHQAHRATLARDQAVAAHERSRATQTFLLDLVDDAARADRPLRAAELMQRAERLARQTLEQTPDQLAAVLAIVGQSAFARGDVQAGPALLTEAAALARDADLQAELACTRALADTRAAAPESAKAVLRRHADDTGRDPGVRQRCALTLAQLLIQNGELAEAGRRVDAVDAQLRDAGPTAWRAQAWVLTMQLYLRSDGAARGLDARAEAMAARLRGMGRDRNDTALGLYNTWGTLAGVSGEPARAVERFAHLVQVMAAEHPQGQVPAYHLAMMANAQVGAGDYAGAEARFAQALQAAEREGSDSERYNVLCQQARLAGLNGSDAQALALYARAQAVPDHGEPLRRNAAPFCRMNQVESALMAGRLADAQRLLQGQGEGAARPARTGWLALQAELAWRQGDAAAAAEKAQAWLDDARALQADNTTSVRTGMALWMLALAQQAGGRPTEARAHAEQALVHLRATVRPGHRWRRWAESGLP